MHTKNNRISEIETEKITKMQKIKKTKMSLQIMMNKGKHFKEIFFLNTAVEGKQNLKFSFFESKNHKSVFSEEAMSSEI